MSKWDEEQKQKAQREEYYRMRPNLKTRDDGRPNEHYQPSYNSQSGGGAGGGCFPAGTQIETPEGVRDISAIRQEEAVVSVDVASGARTISRVLKVRTHLQRRLWRLTFADGQRIVTTSVHSFLVGGEWRIARKIVSGDAVTMSDQTGVAARVVTASTAAAEVADVYNLIVGGTFTFIADGAIVHSFTYCRKLRMVAWQVVASARTALGARKIAAAPSLKVHSGRP